MGWLTMSEREPNRIEVLAQIDDEHLDLQFERYSKSR